MKTAFLIFISLVLFLLSSGFIYQLLAEKMDANHFSAPGQLVDIGGYRLHMHCTGQGSGTVILESGFNCNCLEWSLVQSEIAKFCRVCSYDRAGYGWSDESPFPRTAQQIVHELHQLLENAKAPKPYLLVGHSFGGVIVRLFAYQYPEEVSGIVLVDSSHEDQDSRLPPSPIEEQVYKYPRVDKFFIKTGLGRILMNWKGSSLFSKYPSDIQKVYISKQSTEKCYRASFGENKHFSESLKQLRDVKFHFDTKPLVVLTAGKPANCDQYGITDPDFKEYFDKAFAIMRTLQDELLSQSNCSMQVIAEHSDHLITRNQPDLIVKAISDLIQNMKFNAN